MQLYAVLLTMICASTLFDHFSGALMYPTAVILGQFRTAYGNRALAYAILGIGAALLFTHAVRHL